MSNPHNLTINEYNALNNLFNGMAPLVGGRVVARLAKRGLIKSDRLALTELGVKVIESARWVCRCGCYNRSTLADRPGYYCLSCQAPAPEPCYPEK